MLNENGTNKTEQTIVVIQPLNSVVDEPSLFFWGDT